MIRNQEITEWKPDQRMGWFYYKGARIQLHVSKLPTQDITNLTGHIIQFETDDIGYELIQSQGRKRRIRTLKKVLQVFPPKK